MSTSTGKEVVPRLNLKLLGSKSAPNSARSTQSEEKIKKPKINTTNIKLRTEEGRSALQRREYKPVHARYLLFIHILQFQELSIELFQNKDSFKNDKIIDCGHRAVCSY